MGVLGAAAGVAALGAWRGTTPLLLVAGLALYVAALNAVEALAQEVDHRTLLDRYPRAAGEVLVRHLTASSVLMVAVGAVGVVAAVVTERGHAEAVAVALVVWLPASLAGTAAAAVATVQGAPPLFSASDSLLPPEVAGLRAVVRLVWPPLIATLGFLPVLAGRHAASAAAAEAHVDSAEVAPVLLVAVVFTWVRYHDEIHLSFKQILEPMRQGATPPRA
jgi:hypothetical protein